MTTTPSSRPSLAAEPREIIGKKVAGIRRAGRLPAVVFGRGIDSESVSLDAHEFDQLRRHVGQNALIDLSVHGKTSRPVLIHGVQAHPVNRPPAPRRPVPRPDDGGAHGRRAARRDRIVEGDR